MDFTQFLGFLIAVGAMFFLMVRRAMEEVKRRKNPELYEAEQRKQKDVLKNFLKSLEVDMEEDEEVPAISKRRVEPPPPPPAMVKKQKPKRASEDYKFTDKLENYKPEPSIEKRKLKTNIEDRYRDFSGERVISGQRDAYALKKMEQPSRAHQLLTQVQNKKNMVILYEILHKPKGLR